MATTGVYPSASTTLSINSPWAPAQPALNTALTGAQNAYNSTYNGPLVAPMDPNVTAGQNQALGIAGQGQTTGAAQTGISGVNNVLGAGGFNQPMQYGIGTMQSAINNLNPIASGQYLTGNPWLDNLIQTTNQNIQNDVNAQFSKAGRYGSGSYAGALGQKLAQNEGQLRYQNFQDQLNAMLNANGQLGQLGQGVAGIGNQAIGNVYGGGAALNNYQSPLYADSQTKENVGAQKMDYAQKVIDANNQAPWTRVGNLAQIAQGIGGMGGTQWSTTSGYNTQPNPQTNPSAGQTAAGLLAAGLGAGGNVFSGMFKKQ